LTFHYPNGKRYAAQSTYDQKTPSNLSFANRGMTLEEDINASNDFYLKAGSAVIHKKPTPVQIVSVHYPKRSAAVIKEAYFKQPSTTDYNGIYKGRYIDFEAKETRNKTSFPLNNFHQHQIDHMSDIRRLDGICFVLLRFTVSDMVFLLDAQHMLDFWDQQQDGGRKSIPRQFVEENGHSITVGFNPRIDYLKIIDKIYFNNKTETL
jgi:recombination protein U